MGGREYFLNEKNSHKVDISHDSLVKYHDIYSSNPNKEQDLNLFNIKTCEAMKYMIDNLKIFNGNGIREDFFNKQLYFIGELKSLILKCFNLLKIECDFDNFFYENVCTKDNVIRYPDKILTTSVNIK